MGSVFPSTRIQARKWTKVIRDDLFFPPWTWPDELRRLLIKDHLTNRERAFLFHFLVNNGADPEYAEEVIRYERNFDADALRQLHWLKRNWTRYNYRYWNIADGSYTTPTGPGGMD